MKTRIEKIGKAQAEIYLQKNTSNRPVSRHTVKRYTETMTAGRWVLNGEPLIFDALGNLLDGQHRLHAVIDANVEVEFLVVEGLPTGVFPTLGTGKIRVTGDVISLMGIRNANAVASALSALYRLEKGLYSESSSAPNDQLEGLVKRYPQVETEVAEYLHSPIRSFFSVGIFVAYKIWLTPSYPSEAECFFRQLSTGVGLVDRSPVLQFREKMMGVKCSKARIQYREKMALFTKAWNATVKNEWPRILKFNSGGDKAESFPVLIDGRPKKVGA